MMRNEGNNHGMAQQRTLPRPHRGGRATAHCDLELVDSLDETERGDNGFGSTGR